MHAQIRPNRLEVSDRFPVLGVTIKTDEPAVRAEVAFATEPSLFQPEMKERRTPSTFYSSRASGPLALQRGEAVYLVPPAVLARFVGQQRLYVGLAVASARNGGSPQVAVLPTEGSPYISLKGLTSRSLKRVRVLPRSSLRGAGYGANETSALDWAGDNATPGFKPIGNGTPAPAPSDVGASPSFNGQASSGMPVTPVEYDDGFGPMPAPEAAATPALSQTNGSSRAPRHTAAAQGAAAWPQRAPRSPSPSAAAGRSLARAATASTSGARKRDVLARAQEIVTPFYDPADPATALSCQNDAFSLAREEWFAGVPNTRIFPHSAICQLLMTAPDGASYQGTGFYIGPNRILTCAHNLHQMSSVTIIPGRGGAGVSPFGQHTVSSSSWRIAPGYAGSGDWNNDLAVIDDVPLPAPNGQWFRFLNATPSDRLPVVVCGYSAASRAVPELTAAIDGDMQHLHGGYAAGQSNPEVIEYPILSLMGASGSPVYHLSDGSGELEARVCAVHVSGEPAAQGLNLGCFITPAKIDWIEGRANAFSLGSRALEIPLDPGVGGMSIGVDALQPADIIVSTTSQPISFAIRAGTLSAVSHAMLYVGNGNVIEAVGSGVREIPIEEALADAILAVAYRDNRLTTALSQAIVDHVAGRLENPYNYAGAAFTGYRILHPLPARAIDALAGRLGLEVGEAGATYCSELVLEAFEQAGVPLVASRPGASTPGDLTQLSRSVLTYVGHLKGEDVLFGIPLGLALARSARGPAARAMTAVDGGEVLMPKPPPPRARGLSGAEAAIAIGGFLLETVRDSSGDVTWELDQFASRKHPNDTAPEAPAPYRDAATIRLDTWPVSGGVVDDISAWFSIDWQYNGLSLGNVRISNIGTNDAVGWSLHVRAQIMDDNILYEPGGCAALRVRLHYRFSRGIGADNIAVTDVHLYGDGTHESSSQWLQSSALALAQSARIGSKASTWALDGGAGAVISAVGIVVGAISAESGDVSWQLDAFNQIKHPNDVAPPKPRPFTSATPIRITDWTMGFVDEIGADFVVNWQYSGTSIGNIDIQNVYVNDAIGMGLVVRATIAHDNAVYDNRSAVVHIRPEGNILPLLTGDDTGAGVDMSRQRCAAMRVHFDFTWGQMVGPSHKAAVDLHLFGDGTYTRFERWVQHSFL